MSERVDAHMANEGDGWSGSGANPWHLDATTESVLFLTNESNRPARVGLSITAENVHYYLTSLQLAPHETRAIDIRQLRDAQVADLKGHLIPADATDGSVNWVRIDDVPMSGRLLVIRKGQGTVSSYDCNTCVCPLSYKAQVSVTPSLSFDALAGDAWACACTATYSDCNGYDYYDNETNNSTWSSNDTSVATVDTGGDVTGQSPGSASIGATYSDCVYSYDPNNGCYCSESSSTGDCTALVVQITGPNTVWWFNGQSTSGYSTTITLTALPSDGTSYSWQVVAGTDKASISGYPSANEVDIVGNSWSTSQGDVTVQCQITASGVSGVPSIDLTVRGPYQLKPPTETDEADPNYGYSSYIGYTIEDNFGAALPSPVPLNEYFTTGLNYNSPYNSTNCNWPQGTPQGTTTSTSAPTYFADHISGYNLSDSPEPVPTGPQSPLSTQGVIYFGQEWYVGSTTPGYGALVQADTLQHYIDHGRHLLPTTPDP